MTDNQMLIEQCNDTTIFIVILLISTIICWYNAFKLSGLVMLGRVLLGVFGMLLLILTFII